MKFENFAFATGLSPYTNGILEKLIMGRMNANTLAPNSIMKKILSVPINTEVFLQPLPEKIVQLCIIMMEPIPKEEFSKVASSLDKQTFKDWKFVIPTPDPDAVKTDNKKIIIMKNRSNKVHNIEKGAAYYCPHNSYGVLLNRGETFNSDKAL